MQNGDWSIAEGIYIKNPQVLKATCQLSGKSALHIAAVSGHAHTVEKLTELMSEEELARKGHDGFTALADATMNGIKSMAKCMYEKNNEIVSIATDTNNTEIKGMLPVVLALAYGNKHMARYLYSVTPPEDLLPEKGPNGASLLTYAIRMKQYGKRTYDPNILTCSPCIHYWKNSIIRSNVFNPNQLSSRMLKAPVMATITH